MTSKKKKTTKKKTKKAGKRTASPKKNSGEDLNNVIELFPIRQIMSGEKVQQSKPANEISRTCLPEDYQDDIKLFVSGKIVTKSVVAKCKESEKRIKQYALKKWCNDFVSSSKRPPSVRFYDKSGNEFTFVQTSGVSVSEEKISSVRAMGVDIDPYLKTESITLNLTMLRKHGLEDNFIKFLKNIGKSLVKSAEGSSLLEKKENSKRNFDEIVSNKVSIDSRFIDDLYKNTRSSVNNKNKILKEIVEDSEELGGENEIADKMLEIVSALGFVNQARDPHSPASDKECFEMISHLTSSDDE